MLIVHQASSPAKASTPFFTILGYDIQTIILQPITSRSGPLRGRGRNVYCVSLVMMGPIASRRRFNFSTTPAHHSSTTSRLRQLTVLEHESLLQIAPPLPRWSNLLTATNGSMGSRKLRLCAVLEGSALMTSTRPRHAIVLDDTGPVALVSVLTGPSQWRPGPKQGNC